MRKKAIPYLVALVFFVITLGLAYGLYIDNQYELNEQVRGEVNLLKVNIRQHFQIKQQELLLIADDVMRNYDPSSLDSYFEAKYVAGHFTGFSTISWLDEKFQTGKTLTETGSIIDKPPLPPPSKKVMNILSNGRPVLSYHDGMFYFCIPKIADNQFIGVLVGGMPAQSFFDSFLPSLLTNRFTVEIYSDNHLVYENAPNPGIAQIEDWTLSLKMSQVNLKIALKPTPSLSPWDFTHLMIGIFLIGGGITSLIIYFVFRFWQLSSFREDALKKAEGTLEAEYNSHKQTLESMGIASWSWDLENNLLACNPFLCTLLQRENPSNLKTVESLLECVVEADREEVQQKVHGALETKGQIDTSFRITTPANEIRYIGVKGAIHEDNHQISQISGICWDETEKKEADSLLNFQFELTTKLSQVGTIEEGLQGFFNLIHRLLGWEALIFWDVNPEDLSFFLRTTCHTEGIEESTLLQQTKDKLGNRFLLSEVLSTRAPVLIENFQESPTSSLVESSPWKGGFAFPLGTPDKLLGIVELYQTSTLPESFSKNRYALTDDNRLRLSQFIERIQSFEKLTQSEQIFRDYVQSTDDWIWEIDQNFKLTFTNPIIANILGIGSDDALGKKISDFFRSDQRENILQEFIQSIEKGSGWKNKVLEYQNNLEEPIWLESTVEPILNEKGEIVGLKGYDRNITERIEMDRMRKEFVSVMNHELRTPLTALNGAIELFEEKYASNLSDDQKKLLDLADSNSKRMINLVDDFLDIDTIEQGALNIEFAPINIVDVVNGAIQSYQPTGNESEASITNISPDMTNVMVDGDERRLVKVLHSLFSNSVKFSDESPVIEVQIRSSGKVVRVSVTDHGKGIDPKFHSRIFKSFSQFDSSSKRLHGGVGLGLNICRHAIEQMGGQMSFYSELGKGATFYFELPIWRSTDE
ncbi:MAG: Adaptive-response sensory-kinase SasA [Chlamydiia bacterium]|nr:Adaptive-response sensory-kinase SasA [Chlamydiia bacterium]